MPLKKRSFNKGKKYSDTDKTDPNARRALIDSDVNEFEYSSLQLLYSQSRFFIHRLICGS